MKPQTKTQRAIILAFVALVAVLFLIVVGQFSKPVPIRTWRGNAMHQPYTIIVQDRSMNSAVEDSLRTHLAELLTELEARLSREAGMGLVADFNKVIQRVPFYFGTETWRVIDFEKRLSKTHRAVDITLATLEDLWTRAGSGSQQQPTAQDVQRLFVDTGMDRLDVPAEPYVRKLQPEIKISLDAVAHGYIADRVALFLNENRIKNFHIEMGNVVISQNMSEQSEAVPVCRAGKGKEEPPAKVRLMSGRMATAGVDDGLIHIDPRNGYPVSNAVHCVTVVAESGLVANGLAAALYVMDPNDGLSWLQTNGVAKGEALYVVNKPGGGFINARSHGFPLVVP